MRTDYQWPALVAYGAGADGLTRIALPLLDTALVEEGTLLRFKEWTEATFGIGVHQLPVKLYGVFVKTGHGYSSLAWAAVCRSRLSASSR